MVKYIVRGSDVMDTTGLINYIERLRKSRDMMQVTLLKDIVSTRQYQRYLKGVSVAPIEIVNQLSERIGLQIRYLIQSYELDKKKENKQVQKFFNSVTSYEYEQVEIYKESLSHKNFLVEENEKFFRVGLEMYKYYSSHKNKTIYTNELKRIIDYPHLLKFGIFTDVESYGLTEIAKISEDDYEIIMNRFAERFENSESLQIHSTYFSDVRLLLEMNFYYGKKEQYDKAIECCLKAERILDDNQSTYCRYLIYYWMCMSFKYIKDNTRLEKYLRKCVIYLLANESVQLRQDMYAKIKSNFDVDVNEIIDQLHDY